MYVGILTLLFDSGQIVKEPWQFNSASPEDAKKKFRQIAQARLAVLTVYARIVRLKVTGSPFEKVDWRGKAAGCIFAREFVILRHEGQATRKRLRGVPREIFGQRLTPVGERAFQDFNRVLRQCGCVLVCAGKQPEPIRDLRPWRSSIVLAKNAKPALKRELIALLGKDEGQAVYDRVKPKKVPSRAATV